ncbi:arsenate reductase (glutaredoxin) [Motiliproteus sp. MSK22-1]|uniref:arsenate reductase (glutaredoxin) n=1 Tax=Motiliproteus sp. MSK22-1 TaxID=1897630 RepID=UPI0009762636|nr:arsenate reductase (glutaredoxin) [Motiliproteus sp. MSK22-1]OMH25983.1 arsenate reductase (glutaredoxin) [Motiliproteus sp. MSK22-1]
MTDITLYHNPRCSKSRETLKLLEENNVQPTIRLYLETPPNREEIHEVLKKLGIGARELIRKTEQEYKDNNLKDTNLSEDQLIDALIEYPKLIQRPIAIKGERAVIGRPPESVLDLL